MSDAIGETSSNRPYHSAYFQLGKAANGKFVHEFAEFVGDIEPIGND